MSHVGAVFNYSLGLNATFNDISKFISICWAQDLVLPNQIIIIFLLLLLQKRAIHMQHRKCGCVFVSSDILLLIERKTFSQYQSSSSLSTSIFGITEVV